MAGKMTIILEIAVIPVAMTIEIGTMTMREKRATNKPKPKGPNNIVTTTIPVMASGE